MLLSFNVDYLKHEKTILKQELEVRTKAPKDKYQIPGGIGSQKLEYRNTRESTKRQIPSSREEI
jgi:hypothetical protein